MAFQRIISAVETYYTERVRAHGPTARGVDWNSAESQRLRFQQLLKVWQGNAPFSIIDYGCGYGALVDELRRLGVSFQYQGFDISPSMLEHARQLYVAPEIIFVNDESALEPADYTVASGVFNVRLAVNDEEWHSYLLAALDRFDALSRRGFAFNMLTKYSDPDKMRPDLYYADPLLLFEQCRRYSRHVALLHDYPLYEFTIIVRK